MYVSDCGEFGRKHHAAETIGLDSKVRPCSLSLRMRELLPNPFEAAGWEFRGIASTVTPTAGA